MSSQIGVSAMRCACWSQGRARIATGPAVKTSSDAPTTPRVTLAAFTKELSGETNKLLRRRQITHRCLGQNPRSGPMRRRPTYRVGQGRTGIAAARRAAAAGVRIPHQNRSRPSTNAIGTPATSRPISRACSGPNAYGSLGSRIRFGRPRRDLRQRHLRVAHERVGEHVADAEQVEQRRAVGVGRQRHPRPPPHRDERVVPARCEHRRQPRVPLVGAERRRHGTPTRSASARTSAPTSCTERGDIECTVEPGVDQRASRRPSGSPRRSRRRGRARARRSRRHRGSWSRRPVANAGCSQNRVHATGVDAEREQRLGRRRHERDDPRTRALTCARAAAPSSPRTRPAVITPRSRSSASWLSCSGTLGWRGGAARRRGAAPAVHAARACARGPPSAGRAPAARRRDASTSSNLRLPVAAGRLDLEVARADHALPDRLVEVDVGDPVHRDLDAVLREHAGAEDHAVRW